MSRIAILQKGRSAHADACMSALSARPDVSLFITVPRSVRDAPYELSAYAGVGATYGVPSLNYDRRLVAAIREFDPDLLLVVGWERPAYRKAARQLRGECKRIVCMDNQYLGTLKQRLGVLASSLYLHPYFDGAFVAGDRQLKFARRLGFDTDKIVKGFYSCDSASFLDVPLLGAVPDGRRRFLFLGRLVSEKGIHELVEGYARYRRGVVDPWDLIVAGTGAMASRLAGKEGIEYRGFVQPRSLPHLLSEVACLVVPSRFEPWGVVVHEAACAGLAIVCSEAVGAADLFLQEGVNGRLIGRTAAAVADALTWVHGLSNEDLVQVSCHSRELGKQWSPELWADAVSGMCE